MLIWSFVLLCVGVLAILDSHFNYGYIFRSANAFVYMLLALGILVRTKMLGNQGYRERLVRRNIDLEAQVEELQSSLNRLEKQGVEKNIPA